MSSLTNFSITRRALLKMGAISVVLVANTGVVGRANGQGSVNSGTTSAADVTKPTGLISFNAGWQIPVEDQKMLLGLEQKKIQEAQATQVSTSTAAVDGEVKSVKKSWSDKLKESWLKVKGIF
mgnify:CR=1 FL=1